MSGRFVYVIAAILTLTAVYMCWCGTPQIYDGSYQFAFTLIWQKPYVYLTRFHTFLIWRPFVWLSHWTENVRALTFAYGLPFLLAPVVGLLGSWWVVRRHAPWLIVWAVFGIAAAPLPGQVFVINDSIFQQHLFWPIFLGLLVPLTRPQRAFLAVLVVFQFVHQIGLVLLGGAAGCVLILAVLGRDDREYRRRMTVRLAVAGGLLALMLLKVWLTSSPTRVVFGYDFGKWYDSYAAAEATWGEAKKRWIAGVKGAPIRGLAFMYAAGVLALLAARLRPATRAGGPAGGRRWLGCAALTCVAVAGVIWVHWASAPDRWAWALEYRRWVVPLTLPFYALAFFEAALSVRGRSVAAAGVEAIGTTVSAGREPQHAATGDAAAVAWSARVPICYALAGIYAAVLCLQSAEFAALTRRLMAEVEADPAVMVPRWELGWSNSSPLSHWATPMYVMVLQGKVPHKLLLETEAYPSKLFADPPEVPMASFVNIKPEPGPGGWYDSRPLVAEIRRQITTADLRGRYAAPR